jgi:hypothetical protein
MSAPVILIEASPRRTSDGVGETVRLAGGGGQAPYRYDGEDWRAGVAGLPTIITALNFEGNDLGTGSVPQALELRWTPSSAADLAVHAAYYWTDADISVRVGPEGALPPVILTGRVLDVSVEAGTLRIQLADPAADLKRPVLTERFAGTGGLEGPVEWEGLIRRRAWGRVYNLQGQPIDTANNIYCFGDPLRQWSAIDDVRDKGAAAAELDVLGWQGSAAATFTALQAAEAPQGGGVACPTIACIKWWTEPAGDLTADIRGETAGGYVETAPEIAQRIVSARSGPAFATGTVSAAATARPGVAGWLVDDETTTIAAVLDAILGGVSLLWVLNATGEIVIRQWAWGASQAVAVSHDVARRTVHKPVSARRIGYRKNAHVMSRGDIAAIVFVSEITFEDGTTLEQLLEAQLTAIEAAATLASGKSTIWYQSSPPTAAESVGNDRWVDTDDGNYEYRRVAGSGALQIGGNRIILDGGAILLPWTMSPDQRIAQALTDAAGAQATADGKVITFNQEAEPVAEGLGDLWYQPSTKVLRRWSGTGWVEVSSLGAPAGTVVGNTAAETVEGGAQAANNGVNSDGTIKDDKVGTSAVVAGSLTGTTIVTGSGSSTSFSAIHELSAVTVGSLPSGLTGIKLTGYGQLKYLSGATAGYPTLRIYRITAANAAAYFASGSGSARNPATYGTVVGKNMTLPNWSNVDMGGMLQHSVTSPAAGDVYVIAADVVAHPPGGAGPWSYNWAGEMVIDYYKR